MEKIKRINENEVKVDGCVYRKVEEPKPDFKVGDWVCHLHGGFASGIISRMFRIARVEGRLLYADDGIPYNMNYCRHATHSEIESHLKKICDEKYSEKRIDGFNGVNDIVETFLSYEIEEDIIRYRGREGYIIYPYSKGKFAEIISDKKKLPNLQTRLDFEVFLTKYYRNGNIKNFLDEYEF